MASIGNTIQWKRAEILLGPSLSTISGLVLVAPIQLMT